MIVGPAEPEPGRCRAIRRAQLFAVLAEDTRVVDAEKTCGYMRIISDRGRATKWPSSSSSRMTTSM